MKALCLTLITLVAVAARAEVTNDYRVAEPPFAEMAAGQTYFGTLVTRSGQSMRGFITWQPQQDRFVFDTYQPRRFTRTISASDVAVVRFRELTQEERKMVESQKRVPRLTPEVGRCAARSSRYGGCALSWRIRRPCSVS